ncbi:unnamed protein product [Rhodiola kirilowii]
MNQNNPALLNGVVKDDQQRPLQRPVHRTLGDYTAPRVSGFQSAIAPPGIANNTWELKIGLIQMVQNNQFSGRMNEDPHQHLKHFIQMSNTVKTNGVPPESNYLGLFPFSLSDKASRWLDSRAEGTFTTWDKLAEAFLQQFFPPSKTAHFRNKIISFRSIDGKTLYDTWERYKELMWTCPHHNLELWQIMDTFYQGIDQGMRTLINQTAGGGLTGVPLDETYDIVEKAAQDYHLWISDRGNPKDRKGVQDLCHAEGKSDIAELTNTVKMLATEIKSLKAESAMKPSVVANVGVYCHICGSPSHFPDSCPVMGQDNNGENQEDANYVGQYNQGSGMNRWDNPNRNNPNLSYKPQNQPQRDQNSESTSNIEAVLASFITEQRKTSEDQQRAYEKIATEVRNLQKTVEQLAIHGRMVDNQIAQLANSASREHGKLSSKPDPNHSESMNAVTLRGGKHIEMVPAPATRTPATKSAFDSTPTERETSKEAKNRAKISAQTVAPAPYRPPVPFPQRLKATRRDKEFMQFVDKICTLYITMPFTDAITQIPTYVKFIKEILTGKRKIDGIETVALSEDYRATMHQPMPPKLQDSGSFSIPCDIGGITVCRALCDLGASVSIMSYSLYAKLKLGDLCPTNVIIRLADRSCRLPRGILKDVPIKVKNLYFPADFIVLDISEDVDIPIILGRPFLYTAKTVIDMDRGSLALRVGSERVVFNLPDMSKSPSLFADCDILDSADVDDPISLTSIELYRVLQGCPIPMNICAVSTEGTTKAEQTTGSGKEPCKGELKPLLDPGDIYKERTTKWHYKRIVHRKFNKGKRVLLYNTRLRLFTGKLRTEWSGPYTVARAYLDGHVEFNIGGGKSMVVDEQCLKHYHILKHREPPDGIDDDLLLGKGSQQGTS